MEPGQCCSYGEHSPECPCESRIAELEAEVEHWRDIASSLNEVVERQGAEVERLRKEHLGMSDEEAEA